MFVESSFAGGSVLVYQRNLDPMFFLELERDKTVGSNVAGINSEIGACPKVITEEDIVRAALGRGKQVRNQRQQSR